MHHPCSWFLAVESRRRHWEGRMGTEGLPREYAAFPCPPPGPLCQGSLSVLDPTSRYNKTKASRSPIMRRGGASAALAAAVNVYTTDKWARQFTVRSPPYKVRVVGCNATTNYCYDPGHPGHVNEGVLRHCSKLLPYTKEPKFKGRRLALEDFRHVPCMAVSNKQR